MEDSLIKEYLEYRFPSIMEKDELPDTIELADGSILTRIGFKYKDEDGHIYTRDEAMKLARDYEELPDTINLSGTTLSRSGNVYRDSRGQTYSFKDARNFWLKQEYATKYSNRSRNITKSAKKYDQSYQRRLNREEQAQIDSYTSDGGRYSDDNSEMVIGSLHYYEQPSIKKVVDLINDSKSGIGYVIDNNNTVLIGENEFFSDPGVLKILQTYYRFSPDKVGIISKAPGKFIYPGSNGNLILRKVEYMSQIKKVRDAEKLLLKKFPFLKVQKKYDMFMDFASEVFTRKDSPNELEFFKWLKRDYLGLDKVGGKTIRLDLNLKGSNYAPLKKGAINDRVVDKVVKSDAAKDYYNLYGKELNLDFGPMKSGDPLNNARKEIEQALETESIDKSLLFEIQKVMDLINKALKNNKITKEEAIKAFIILQKAIREGKDNVIYRLKDIMIKASKGNR